MIPIGIKDFEEIRIKNFYYVDKTGTIRELLASFFKMGGDKHIFDGLEISNEKKLCKEYTGK